MEWNHGHKSLRQQLIEAQKECRRQIEILAQSQGRGWFDGPGAKGQDNSQEIALMETEYSRLTEALNNLGPDEAQKTAQKEAPKEKGQID
jgi:hypothetical protein